MRTNTKRPHYLNFPSTKKNASTSFLYLIWFFSQEEQFLKTLHYKPFSLRMLLHRSYECLLEHFTGVGISHISKLEDLVLNFNLCYEAKDFKTQKQNKQANNKTLILLEFRVIDSDILFPLFSLFTSSQKEII